MPEVQIQGISRATLPPKALGDNPVVSSGCSSPWLIATSLQPLSSFPRGLLCISSLCVSFKDPCCWIWGPPG